MADTKFTPGPWELRTDRSEYRIYARGQNVSGVAARINTDWPFPEQQAEQRANAHLIAAAPELYEALQDVLGLIPLEFEESPLVAFAKATLAKARREAGS